MMGFFYVECSQLDDPSSMVPGNLLPPEIYQEQNLEHMSFMQFGSIQN